MSYYFIVCSLWTLCILNWTPYIEISKVRNNFKKNYDLFLYFQALKVGRFSLKFILNYIKCKVWRLILVSSVKFRKICFNSSLLWLWFKCKNKVIHLTSLKTIFESYRQRFFEDKLPCWVPIKKLSGRLFMTSLDLGIKVWKIIEM